MSPSEKYGSFRVHPLLQQLPVYAYKLPETVTLRGVNWRRRTMHGLAARFAAMRIRMAKGSSSVSVTRQTSICLGWKFN